MRGAQLDAVEPGRARVAGHQLVVLDDLLDLARAERARLDLEALARHRGRGDGGSARRRVDLLAAAVEELHEEPGAARVHGVGDAREPLDDARVVAGDRVAGQQAARVHRRGLDADQPGAAARRAPRGRRRSRPSAGRPRRASSDARSRRCGCGSRSARSAAGSGAAGRPSAPRIRQRGRPRVPSGGAHVAQQAAGWLRSRASCASAAVTTSGSSALPGLLLQRHARVAPADEYLRELHVGRRAGDDAALERDVLPAQAGGIAACRRSAPRARRRSRRPR